MSPQEPANEGIHINRNQLTLLSVIVGGMIIFSAHAYSQRQIPLTENENDAVEQVQPVVAEKEQATTPSDVQPEPVVKLPELSLPEIKKEWSPRVVQIVCYDNSYIASGSGVLTLVNYVDSGKTIPTLVTNRHVVMNSTTGNAYEGCAFQTTTSSQVIPLPLANGQYSTEYDVAYFPSSGTNPPPGARSGMKVCNPNDVEVGDSIAILGYPSSGGTGESSRAITLTTGIISSYDGDYYVTDAKIDHGNSGGAAIHIKNDCYLGIPTWVRSGGFESLGRILSAQNVLTP